MNKLSNILMILGILFYIVIVILDRAFKNTILDILYVIVALISIGLIIISTIIKKQNDKHWLK